MVRASYIQIYNDTISDLLRPDRSNLQIREDKRKGIYVENVSEWAIRSPSEVFKLLKQGANTRATATTKLNALSSRSHAIFIIILEQMKMNEEEEEKNSINNSNINNSNLKNSHNKRSSNDFSKFSETNSEQNKNSTLKENYKQVKVGKLNIVDLAGSERARITGATGARLEECKKINQSLSALGNVIAALVENGGKGHIPYRDSKITRLLEDSLGGNCKTTFFAMVSPAIDAFGESVNRNL